MATETRTYPILEESSRANPQAIYDQMRQYDPVYPPTGLMTGNTFWFLTNYEDVVAALKDQRLVRDTRKNLPPGHFQRIFGDDDGTSMWEAINRHMLYLDPPDHTRLRALVHKAFTPKRVRDLEPRILAIADELLDKMAQRHEGNLIDDFAYPLPITVIAEMLGVHAEKRDK